MNMCKLLVLLLFTWTTAFAQEQEPTTSSFESLVEEVTLTTKGSKVSVDSILKELQSSAPSSNDSIMTTKYLETMNAYYDYRIFGFKHRESVFHWQLISTIIIFIMVNLLAIAGILFSWLQFKKGLKAEGNVPESETEVELSIKSVRIKSSIIGLIILVLSLAFFYLYLVYIYPIREIF